jgi:hypothetical protein
VQALIRQRVVPDADRLAAVRLLQPAEQHAV